MFVMRLRVSTPGFEMAECASNAGAKITSVITDHPFRLSRL
jgi:hypothetical protein